ncbi:hypothetical protein ACFQHN_26070 [Natrialbaceae archaeon GCM10025896]
MRKRPRGSDVPIDPLSNPAMDGDLGGLRRLDNGQVSSYHGYLLVDDGEFIEPIARAKDNLRRARHTLWNRIGPLRYGDIRIAYRSEVWNDDCEEWWRAEELSLYEDGEPVVTFERKGTEPREFIRLRGSQLAELVRDGTLVSKQAVNDELEEMLESFADGGEAREQ